jgi:hypothetical protein
MKNRMKGSMDLTKNIYPAALEDPTQAYSNINKIPVSSAKKILNSTMKNTNSTTSMIDNFLDWQPSIILHMSHDVSVFAADCVKTKNTENTPSALRGAH